MTRKTQADKMLELLERHPEGICAQTILTDFSNLGISHRYAAAVEVLRKRGYRITTEQCPHRFHSHAGNLAFYRLEAKPGTLFG